MMPCSCTWTLAFSLKINRCSDTAAYNRCCFQLAAALYAQYSSLQKYNHCARRECSLRPCGPLTCSSNSGAVKNSGHYAPGIQDSCEEFRTIFRTLPPTGSHSVAPPLKQAQLRSASSRAVLTRRGSSPHTPTQLNRASTLGRNMQALGTAEQDGRLYNILEHGHTHIPEQ